MKLEFRVHSYIVLRAETRIGDTECFSFPFQQRCWSRLWLNRFSNLKQSFMTNSGELDPLDSRSSSSQHKASWKTTCEVPWNVIIIPLDELPSNAKEY
ncbi:hypothetical protein VNO77_13630 [Canavalia gladiata]|uniref:Uncharacterized protein n=1 Tax=Canavalia gladiata TaxID=3824 RepID=A0AAN9M2U7_CANGL